MEIIKLAWRNIWRNKRRTIITASSLMFAVIFGIVMRSMQLGTYDRMIDSAVRQYSGFIQVQEKSYWKDKTIDDLMPDSMVLRQRIAKLDGVIDVLPRLESFALISSGNKTKGAFFQGIDPLLDDQMTQISHKVVQGRFLEKDDDGVLLSQRLAGFVNINVGDTIVLLSQGYHGVTAADVFAVRGIVKIPNPKLDKSLIIGSLKKVQEFYGAEGMLTSMVVNIKSKNNIDMVLPEVTKIIDSGSLVALSWTDMNKELKQQIESDNGSGMIMLGILYIVIFFGILGTIIMMTAERQKEFGVMVALGMHRYYLALIVFIETILLGLVGAVTGGLISAVIVAYYYNSPIHIGGEMKEIYEQFGIEPVLAFSKDFGIFINQFYVVLALLFVAVLYSIVKISGFKIVDALHT
jgi:ABC-type lipoprotein release transport system permease subunit